MTVLIFWLTLAVIEGIMKPHEGVVYALAWPVRLLRNLLIAMCSCAFIALLMTRTR